jgi:hypothetical protein
MDLEETKARNDCACEDQQQFNQYFKNFIHIKMRLNMAYIMESVLWENIFLNSINWPESETFPDWIRDCRGSDYEEYGLLGCNFV